MGGHSNIKRMKLKVYFTDFWSSFNKEDNYFMQILSERYDVEISKQPDILFYSCYGWDYLNFNCTRIFYTAENKKPDFTACDFAISFDYNDRNNHYKLPFYAYKILSNGLLKDLDKTLNRSEAETAWKKKKGFCSMVVSNPEAKERLQFFKDLNDQIPVDSGGAVMNNVGGRVTNKMNFIRKYRFVIAFENESYPGYLTEKIVESILANAIPLYWGDPDIEDHFNPARFIDRKSFGSNQEMIKRIMEIENNQELALKILTEPVFKNGSIPKILDERAFKEFLWSSVEKAIKRKPIAQSCIRYIHLLNIFKYKLSKRIKSRVNLFGLSIR